MVLKMDVKYKRLWLIYLIEDEPDEFYYLMKDLQILYWAKINCPRNEKIVCSLYLEFKYPISKVDFELVFKFRVNDVVSCNVPIGSREDMLNAFKKRVNDDITKIEWKYPIFLF